MTGRRDVFVVIGIGGMGQAIARRMGSGRSLVLADIDEQTLATVGSSLSGEGYSVTTSQLDVSDAGSAAALAATADELGPVRCLAHTAGLSPVQASAESIIRIDLLGVAFVLEEFVRVIAPGGAAVVISSMSAYMIPALDPEEELQLARTPASELCRLGFLDPSRHPDAGMAYGYAKRANQLRVRAASVEWGRRSARVNSISPGVIATPMGQAELSGGSGSFMRAMVDGSGTGRLGTPDDIAGAAEFLLGPASAFVTGTDLLVDGGVVGAMTTGHIAFG
jgi:NAD(P)-dependent dehydrogenase (short-subunit alcohol dehydrogenase family)